MDRRGGGAQELVEPYPCVNCIVMAASDPPRIPRKPTVPSGRLTLSKQARASYSRAQPQV